MKRYVFILIFTISLFACGNDDAEENSQGGSAGNKNIGKLIGDVDYKVANQEDLDNVRIEMRQYSNDSIVEGSWRISNSGIYEIELPVGRYKLNLDGNRCKSEDLPMIVEIVKNYDRHIDVNLERLYYSMIIQYLGREINQGDTISLDSKGALDIINKYSSNSLTWEISSIPWVELSTNGGAIAGGKSNSFTFKLIEDKLPKYGWNYTNLILSTPSDYGSFTVVVRAFKNGGEPEKVLIAGEGENACPSNSVILVAHSEGASSYEWYNENTIIDGTTNNSYEVTESGIYYAIGKNSIGIGKKSDGKPVVIKICLPVPETAVISGNSSNNCYLNEESVVLTANATNATEYLWYKENLPLGIHGNTYLAKENGTYYVKGKNTSGESANFSNGKTVTISSCRPNTPTNVIAKMNGSSIKVTWSSIPLASKYKVCINGNDCYTTTSTSYIFQESLLSCGTNNFEVKAVNNVGEESLNSGFVTCFRDISLTKPELKGTALGNVVDFSWKNSTGVTSVKIEYIIERSVSGGKYEQRTITEGTSYSESLPSGTPFSDVDYRIRARAFICDSFTYSDYSTYWTFIPYNP